MNAKNIEKFNSKRNHVLKDGSRVVKHFFSHDDYRNESLIYDKLSGTSLAPCVLENYKNCIITEYIDGISLFDALEQSVNDRTKQISLFKLFLDWYEDFRKQTGFILGDTNFKNFIIRENVLYGVDFETCKRGEPIEDIFWQTAMLATLQPAFSLERKHMARLFLSMSVQNLDYSAKNESEKLTQAFEAICQRRRVRLDPAELKEILSSVEISACLLAGGKSLRMGEDKRLLPHKNKSMLQSTSENLIFFAAKYLSLSEEEPSIQLETFKNILDQRAECGPIGGIVSALSRSSQPWTLFITSDMPLLNMEMLDYLVKFRNPQYDAIIFSENGAKKIFPLLLQKKTALPAFKYALEHDKFALWQTMQRCLKTLEITAEECPSYTAFSFKNINTKEDYEELKAFQ